MFLKAYSRIDKEASFPYSFVTLREFVNGRRAKMAIRRHLLNDCGGFLDKTRAKNWDLIVKIVGLIALVASGLWTLYKFRDDRRVDLDNQAAAQRTEAKLRIDELNRFVFERQAGLYFEAAQAASTIATSDNKAEKKAASDKFYELYFGQLVVVEDRRVELAMIEFSRCLNQNGAGCSRTINTSQDEKPLSPELVAQLGPATLSNLSLELAACMRSSLKADRGIDFGKLIDPVSRCPYD